MSPTSRVCESTKEQVDNKRLVALAGLRQEGAKRLSKLADLRTEFTDQLNSFICPTKTSSTPAEALAGTRRKGPKRPVVLQIRDSSRCDQARVSTGQIPHAIGGPGLKEKTRCPGAGWVKTGWTPGPATQNVRLPAVPPICLSRHDDSEELEPQHTFSGAGVEKGR